ncbi:unnamed protein product [Arctia plantaginis]|uniref:Uncharacterized protein n=1 Tax=Arctia plantaginis TaxID=874455 RepID=A0A8S0ZYA3_ARCPL|nr:unnamed protein product [Arctia plantaginis]
MCTLLYLATVLTSIYAVNSYILLTANLDDFHAIGKQIAASPVGSQIHQIIRRASAIFNENVNNKLKKRSDADPLPDRESVSDDDSLTEKDEAYLKAKKESMAERRAGEDDVVALGKNASYYLQSLKKIFESV